jgi:DNA-binding transcriptional LysR family regulator
MRGHVTVNNSEAYLAACLAGVGIIQAPAPALRALIREGRLSEVLPRHRAPPLPVSLVYPNRRHLPKRVHLFMLWVEEVLKAHVR